MAFETADGGMRCLACGTLLPYADVAAHAHDVLTAPVVTGPWAAEAAARAQQRPTFTLKGETFMGVSEFSLGVQMDLAVALEAETVPTAALVSILNGMVAPEDEQRFKALLYSKTVQISPEELRDVLFAVVSQMGGRPFPSSQDSSVGPTATGDGSTATAP